LNQTDSFARTRSQAHSRLITNVITATVNELKAVYQEDHVGYVGGRFIAYLQDQDRPQ
jgi:hypothetical protein